MVIPSMEFLEFGEKKIRIYRASDIWFCCKDVAKVLNYSNTTEAIAANINKVIKKSFNKIRMEIDSNNYNRNDLNTIYTNKSGIVQLLIKCRLPNKEPFINWCKKELDIDITLHSKLYKEQEYIGYIIKTFAHLEHKEQFTVDKYRIDLYFPDKKIAIECDELGHNDRDSILEAEREEHIMAALGCKFIRFNPDESDFCIFTVLNRIMQAINDN